MKIDRYMVTLFFEIRRNLPPSLQPQMMISNPQLGEDMIRLYHNTHDDNIKLLIQVFLKRAGEDWYAKISQKKRRYRGAEFADSSLPTIDKHAPPKAPPAGAKKKLIYRGQIVD